MRINWISCAFDYADGYGKQGLNMLPALRSLGHDVRPVIDRMIDTPRWVLQEWGLNWDGLSIFNHVGSVIRDVPGRMWAFSMWEDSIVSPQWADNINAHAERLLVPCTHNVQVFQDAGVTVPIHIVPLGVDHYRYSPTFRLQANDRPFTFMTLADRGYRKGWNTAWLAFSMAFPADQFPDVRLIVKSRAGRPSIPFADSRISHWAEDCFSMSTALNEADCFVFPSRGEGWGLPPREAVAMGIPTIAPRHTGLAEGIDCWATVILETLVSERSPMGNGGTWYSCDIKETAAAMRWCYENREQAQSKARAGAEWVRREQSWDCAARILSDLLEVHA